MATNNTIHEISINFELILDFIHLNPTQTSIGFVVGGECIVYVYVAVILCPKVN